MNVDAIERIIRGVLERRMPDVNIVSVNAEEDIDFDGDEVFNVTVVFEAKSELDAGKVAGLIRHMRPALNESGERRFPIMSFISRKEAKKAGIEAA